jgi:transposase-like protein
MTKSDYTPDDHEAQTFARFKRHYEAQKALLPEVKEMAAHALKQGATVSQLAKLTGLTDELFRRIARAEGVERLRPPTVGREVQPPASEPE